MTTPMSGPALDRMKRAAEEEYTDECCGGYLPDMDGEPACCWRPVQVCSVYADDIKTALGRIAELEAEASKARAEEREAIVGMLRLFIDEIIHTSHADGLGMGDQFRESVVAECIQRIQRRAQEGKSDG